jgi:hypothetical protein
MAFALALAALATTARADLANGESIVRNTCASCHGFPPIGGPEFLPGNPSLLPFAINGGVPAMGFLRGVLTQSDINDIVAYLTALLAPPPATPTSYQGLWLRTPFAQESGWGINFTQQGTNLFATWFTYDTDGSGMWLVMSDGHQTSPNNFAGTLYRTTGPGFDASTFTPISQSNYTQVGTFTVSFSDANTGSMTYTVNNVTQTKPIGRFIFVAGTNCTVGGTAGSTPNYTDLWWRKDGTEGGWGVNLVHQGDILFATWFTYQSGGTASLPAKGMWLVMSNLSKTSTGVYSGIIQRTTGPNPFDNAVAFDPSKVVQTTVGNATFTFTDANNGTFNYTVNGVTQSKPITRLSFSSPATVCQ